MVVAFLRLAPGVRDPDDRAALEGVIGEALRLDPRPVKEAVEVGAPEPVLAAKPRSGHRRVLCGRRWRATIAGALTRGTPGRGLPTSPRRAGGSRRRPARRS